MKTHIKGSLPTASAWDDAAGPLATGGGSVRPRVDEAVLDEAALARLRELDPDGRQGVVGRVLGAYRQSLERHLGELSAALEPVDRMVLLRAAHTLKSSSAAVGALAFSQSCGELEAACRDAGRPPPAGQVEALIHEGRRVMQAVGAMLDG